MADFAEKIKQLEELLKNSPGHGNSVDSHILVSEVVLAGGALKYFVASFNTELADLIPGTPDEDAFFTEISKLTDGGQRAADAVHEAKATETPDSY